MSKMLSITKKELKAYFGSPMAAIFIGAFLFAALFSFFWVEAFFARNIADIRPLFRWMPILMVFLVAALTMRQWSEEQKMGTLEVLLTLPVKLSHLVIGKFLAVLILIGVALLLTLGLPVTVAMLGNIDWGPVIGGYLGTLLMAAAYIAIGLFISSRTDNQIIALIMTVLAAGFFYIIGSAGIADFMGSETGNLFRAMGTGSRFTSIERGVIDLRDLVYYAALTTFFLALNIHSLDRKRWSHGENTLTYRRNAVFAVVLIAANILCANLWLAKIGILRLDLTQNREYSISPATRDMIASIDEPLLMRGYFSEKTHPLLAPLVPRIKDLMVEYGIASGGKLTVAFLDPKLDEAAEVEANQQYGIKPLPFQVSGRYEASVVNSYFNILIKYGDQHIVLGFEDLIEIKPRKDGQVDVALRNLEYDLTKSIKKAVYGFQSVSAVFENSKKDMELIAVITPSRLPEVVKDFPEKFQKVANDLRKESGGKLKYTVIDPDKEKMSADQVQKQYGLEPLAAALFSKDTFFMGLILKVGENKEHIPIAGDMGEAEIRQGIEGVIKRTTSGFLKTIGIWTPPPEQPMQQNMFQQQQQPQDKYQMFQSVLRENYNIERVNLAGGRVAGNIDILLVAAPQGLKDAEVCAIDQYLMRGGAAILLAGNYLLDISPYSQSLNLKKSQGGLRDLLTHYGINVDETLVMDKQNEPFPVPMERNIGGIVIREIKRLDYPYFVDVRADGMNRESPILGNLPAVTMNWVSPVTAAKDKNESRKVIELLHSSKNSWTTKATDIQPNFNQYPDTGFAPAPTGETVTPQTLAVAVQGSFKSFFADKPDPRPREKEAAKKEGPEKKPKPGEEEKKEEVPLEPLIKESPNSTRLVVVGSSEFVNDTVISISRSLGQDRFMNSLEFLQNLADWSVEDEELLTIRSRGSHARLLVPLKREQQHAWEWLNYGIAMAGLLIVSIYGMARRRREVPMTLV